MNDFLTPQSGSRRMTVTLMCVSAFQMSQLIISTALSQIAAAFPGKSATAVQMILTFPDLAILLATILVGQLSARISPKRLIIAGLCCVGITGIGGYFFHGSLGLLYLWSSVLGLGRGLFATSVIVCIQTCYGEQERGRILGWQSGFLNVSGVVLTILSGFLAGLAWHSGYLIFLLALPVVLLVIVTLPNGKCKPQPKAEQGKRRFYPAVLVYSFLAFLFLIVYNVYIMNSSMLFEELGKRDTSLLAGLSNGMFLLGGAVSAFVFSWLSRRLGDKLITLAFLTVALGLFICCVTSGIVPIIAAGFIVGLGISLITPQISFSISCAVPPEAVSFCTSVYLGCLYVGGFVSAPVITPLASLFGESVVMRFATGTVFALLFALVSAVLTSKIAGKGKRP